MSQPSNSPPPEWPRISAAIVYEDIRTALDWLAKAFGFEERVVVEDGEGNIVHCEMEFGDGVIMITGADPERRSASPRKVDGQWTQSLYVFVDDVDAHCERARAAGAEILEAPSTRDYGDRVYGCVDYEGHPWWFGRRVDQAAWDASTQPAGAEDA